MEDFDLVFRWMFFGILEMPTPLPGRPVIFFLSWKLYRGWHWALGIQEC